MRETKVAKHERAAGYGKPSPGSNTKCQTKFCQQTDEHTEADLGVPVLAARILLLFVHCCSKLHNMLSRQTPINREHTRRADGISSAKDPSMLNSIAALQMTVGRSAFHQSMDNQPFRSITYMQSGQGMQASNLTVY